jgi:hypothetical protein
MDDFYSVTFRNSCRVPVRAAHDAPVQLDCETARIQAEGLDQIAYDRALGHLDLILVDDDGQVNLGGS